MSGPRIHDYRRETLGFGHEIRRFDAVAPGRFEVEGIGPGLRAGDGLRFTLKGSRSLDLTLHVQSVRHRIVPENGWTAILVGEDFTSLAIHSWKVVCDRCGVQTEFEFAAPEGAGVPTVQAAASARIGVLGWGDDEDRHTCPECSRMLPP